MCEIDTNAVRLRTAIAVAESIPNRTRLGTNRYCQTETDSARFHSKLNWTVRRQIKAARPQNRHHAIIAHLDLHASVRLNRKTP